MIKRVLKFNVVVKMVKILINGKNNYVRIPKEVKIVAGIQTGDEVLVQYNKETEQITIKKINP